MDQMVRNDIACNRATPAVYMLCVKITCRVQDLPAAAAISIALH